MIEKATEPRGVAPAAGAAATTTANARGRAVNDRINLTYPY